MPGGSGEHPLLLVPAPPLAVPPPRGQTLRPDRPGNVTAQHWAQAGGPRDDQASALSAGPEFRSRHPSGTPLPWSC